MEERVPEIRFKGFDEPWIQQKFCNLAETRRGLTYSPDNICSNQGIRVLRSCNIDKDSFITNDNDVFVDPNVVKIPTVQVGDILITAANGSANLVGKHAIINGITPNSAIHGGFMLVASTKKPNFVNALMSASWYGKFINLFVSGGNGSIGNLNKNDLDEQNVVVPDGSEQDKIGVFFNKLDTYITLTQQKLDQLKTLKKACLEKMFPKEGETVPEVRFQGFEGPWEKIIFEEVVKRSSEQSADASLPRVEYEDIVSGIGTINKDLYQKNSHKSGIIFHKGDVLYGKLRPYLQNWLLAFFDGIAVGDFWVLQPQGIDSGFLYRLIQGRKFSDTANQSTGTKMPRADWKLVSKTAFFIPQNVNEQFVIGDFFMNLDSLIISSEQKLGQLKTLKKALLDRMFV